MMVWSMNIYRGGGDDNVMIVVMMLIMVKIEMMIDMVIRQCHRISFHFNEKRDGDTVLR